MPSRKKSTSGSLSTVLFVLNVAALATLISLASSGVFNGKSCKPCVNGTAGEAGPPGPQGPAGASASSSPESFSVSLRAPYVFSTTTVYEPINNFTATVDTDAFPDVSPRTLFLDLTASTFNLGTGIFTVGANGTYTINFSQIMDAGACSITFQLTVNGAGQGMVWQGNDDIYSGLMHLRQGDFVQIRGWTSVSPCSAPVSKLTAFSPPANAYALVWSMAKIA